MHLFSSAAHVVGLLLAPATVAIPTLQDKPLPPPPVAGVEEAGAGVGVVPPPPPPVAGVGIESGVGAGAGVGAGPLHAAVVLPSALQEQILKLVEPSVTHAPTV